MTTAPAPYPPTTGQEPCRTGNPDRWFPDLGANGLSYEAVKAECRPCPTREACLLYALHHDVQGVWGATSPEDRKNLRRKQGIKPKALSFKDLVPANSAKPGHGSWSGVVQHRKRYEANCPACASFVARQKEVVQKAKPTRGKSPVRPYSQEQTACPDCAKTMTRKSLPKHRRETCRAVKVAS